MRGYTFAEVNWNVIDFQYFMVIPPSKSINMISCARKCHEYVEMFGGELRIRLQWAKKNP